MNQNTVRKINYLLIAALFIVAACAEGDGDSALGCTDPKAANHNPEATVDDCNCEYTGFTAIGTPPAEAVKNVIIEEFTGEWCGWCVDGTYRIETLIEDYPGRVFTTAIHQGDFLETDLTRPLMERFGASFFPSGVVDRKIGALSREIWEGRTIAGLAEVAKVDIAIETQFAAGNMLEGVIHVDFKENLNGATQRVIVYIVENGISALAQQNYYANLGSAREHPYYSLPRTLNGEDFTHNFVLRDIAGNFEIADKAIRNEGVFKRKFSIDVSGYNQANLQVIALVVDSELKNSLNVIGVDAGSTVDW